MAAPNIPARFFESVEKWRNKDCLQYKEKNRWSTSTYGELAESVNKVSSSLYRLGLRKGDKVAIWARNCNEWVIADLAVLQLGGVVIPIYGNINQADLEYIVSHSEAKMVFVENASDAEWMSSLETPLEYIIYEKGNGTHDNILNMSRLLHAHTASPMQKPILGGDDLASIVYTPGVTGNPKGVMLTHGNILANVEGLKKAVPFDASDCVCSFLPLCHIFGKVAGYYAPLFSGTSIAFCGVFGEIEQDAQYIRPTVIIGLPALYDKYYDSLTNLIDSNRVFSWTLDKIFECEVKDKPLSFIVRMLRNYLYHKVHMLLGGKIAFAISLGSPMHQKVSSFFHSLGILILEGYGLIENSPFVSINRLDNYTFGTVGIPLPTIKTKIGEDGELLIQGPCVTKGYYKDEDKSNKLFDLEGWMRTGDLVEVDDDGFITIINRKEDVIETSLGREVFPLYNEASLLSSHLIDQAVIVGNDREFISALIFPNINALQQFALHHNISYDDIASLLENSSVYQLMEEEIAQVQANLDPYQRVKRFTLLDTPFSIERGELTITQNIHRKNIERFFSAEIDFMYRKDGN